ncbi:hypothetical protein Tco_1343239 [Tanacetum coccineum]
MDDPPHSRILGALRQAVNTFWAFSKYIIDTSLESILDPFISDGSSDNPFLRFDFDVDVTSLLHLGMNRLFIPMVYLSQIISPLLGLVQEKEREKLEEVKARLDFGDARKKSTRAQESVYYESRIISPRRQRHSRSPPHNPSVFTRLRRERSPRHEYKSKARRESTVFKRLGSGGRNTSAYSGSHQESSRYTENHSESEGSEGGYWKSKLQRKKSSVEDDDLS